MASLSGGEKRRLCLARLTRGQYDYLCLDEPTNHLDITAREGLEDALRAYPGAAVLISHDRELLDAATDRVLWVEDGGVAVYVGGLEQCLARRAEARSGAVRNPILFKKLGDKIMGLEEELEILRESMAQPDSYLDPDVMRELQEREAAAQQALQQALQQADEKWENWS